MLASHLLLTHPSTRRLHNQRQGPISAAQTPSAPVLALDLNGVLVDSHAESTRSAWLAATELWPDVLSSLESVAHPKEAGARRAWAGGDWQKLTGTDDDGMPKWLDAKLRLLRPVLETGDEAMLMMRISAEEAAASQRNARTGTRPLSVGEIISNWDADLRDTLLAKYGMPREMLAAQYAGVRDRWIEDDPDGWMGANKIDEHAVEALRRCIAHGETSVAILTGKPTRFASALLRHHGVELDDGSIFGLESGTKRDVLCELLADRPPKLSFVDDNAATLRSIAADPRLFGVEMWFAAWGYSTPQQEALAASMPRVRSMAHSSAMYDLLGTA